MAGDIAADPLASFSESTRAWFNSTFAEPTAPQAQGWPSITTGAHTLICAPTGTGKTLAAFLWALDRLATEPTPTSTRVLYISPLRALASDIEKNLQAPLRGISLAAEGLGSRVAIPTVGVRTGDTAADERRRLIRNPPEILITTPESLFLMLTSQARRTLNSVEHVIVDEIHALAGGKRGAHLMVSLERLEELCERSFQRIALSATQRPLEEIARFLGGREIAADGTATPRPVNVISASTGKVLEIEVVVPVEDMGDLGSLIEEPVSQPATAAPQRRSIWPQIHPRLLELVQSHRSTLIFSNARRLSERLASKLNELHLSEATTGEGESNDEAQSSDEAGTGNELVKAHHGSLSRQRRNQIEDELKRGELKGLVATSSLELGIDMGAVDLVVQVSSPGSVASGLQRIGRAGHQVGEPSRGKIFPKHRADLLESATVVDRMHRGLIEETRIPRNPLDVAAQQIVAMCAMDDWSVDALAVVLRRCACFAELSDEVLNSVLDLLSGTYPSEEFAGLTPRIVWDRATGSLRGRASAQRLAVTNAGTIPDRGLFGVFLSDGVRVGELDEEMVYESRVGETFLLGASTWRITDITFERVIVVPSPGEPGKMPFWRGDGPGRSVELGRAMGELVRELIGDPDPIARLQQRHGLDELAASNLVAYLGEQAEATGVVPDDRSIVVERFRDEIGDWRICVLSPLGARVNAPWGMALQARLAELWGVEVDLMWSDDGIVMRLPAAVDDLPVDELFFDPDEIRDLVVSRLPETAMFASRFRECAARALLLPRRRPDQRTPLWQQRQRAADLLGVAAKYPSFPILLEATRECVNDVFDLPALEQLMRDGRSRRLRVVAVDTAKASPFSQSLLFSWIAVYMYEGDAPLAERRAAALALDRELLADLLGAEELRELLDPEVLADIELELHWLSEGRQARDADEAHDLLRRLGPLSLDDIAARSRPGADVAAWIECLVAERRAIEVRLAGREVMAAAADAGRLRDAVGVALAPGLPAVCTDPVPEPLADLCRRYAATHGPFQARDVSRWLGLTPERVAVSLGRLVNEGRLLRGEFRPGGIEREFCDAVVLQRLRRRSLAALRREVEPVDPEVLARFLPAWQGVGSRRRGVDGLAEIIAQLQGMPIAASVLEREVLAVRMSGFRSSDLDQLTITGEVVWAGAGPIGATDGRVRLVFRDQLPLLASSDGAGRKGPIHDVLRARLADRGASFWPELVAAVAAAGLPYDTESILTALWDLVWAGEVSNDSLAPIRALGTRPRRAVSRRRVRPGSLQALGPPSAVGRWSLVASLLPVTATSGAATRGSATRGSATRGGATTGSETSATTAATGAEGTGPSPTAILNARARQLLDRYGVLTREAALGEGHEGGFAGVYPVLKALEERGELRRGYFVAGLGAAQFALPGAIDRLRSLRTVEADDTVVTLAASDPAQPYGAALRWPESPGRPVRAAGAHVVLIGGHPAVELERGGRSLISFAAAEQSDLWIGALIELVKDGRLRKLEIAKVDGRPIRETPYAERLAAAGFKPGYRGLAWRG